MMACATVAGVARLRIPDGGTGVMSRYQVDKFLRDINHDRALAERWRAESGAVFDRYDLTSDEREALAAWHVRKLYDMGANPLLLLLSAFASGKGMREYMGAMNPKE
jgi:hypothetical protein